ncbi:MAG: glutamate 5-kinase, partial [Pelagibacterales bacterium]|nr:glutamate 5-kinase [Pelagibacterales bacterium]
MASLKTIKNKSIKDAKRIVIKIGSSLIINNKTRNLNYQWMKSLAQNIDFLIKNKKEVLIVTSGAIALGKNELNLNKQSLKLHEKQACAATGQILLAKGWKEVFEKLSLKCAQILVGHSDLETRRSAMNARVTLNTLLKLNTIPVINENDTVATIEIRYGDNDQLAGRVAHLVGADLVILLSDVKGLYTGDPKRNKKVKFISKVEEI